MKTKLVIILGVLTVVVFCQNVYAGFQITQITDNDYGDYYPQINTEGKVVWARDFGDSWDILYWDGESLDDEGHPVVVNISNTPDQSDYRPQINADGKVVWQGDDEIFLATPFDAEEEFRAAVDGLPLSEEIKDGILEKLDQALNKLSSDSPDRLEQACIQLDAMRTQIESVSYDGGLDPLIVKYLFDLLYLILEDLEVECTFS